MIVNQEQVPVTPTFLQRHWPKLTALGIWAVVIGGYLLYARANNLTVRDALMAVQSGFYGPLVYILLYALRPLLFFPASVLTAASGLFFGATWGVLFTILASNISALVAYFVGVYFGRGVLEASDSTNLIQRYANRMRTNSFETVIIMRLLFLPYDFVNYLSGFLRINWKPFLLATAIGSLPGTVSIVLIGVAAGNLDDLLNGKFSLNPWALGASILLITVSIVISRFIKRREKVDTWQK